MTEKCKAMCEGCRDDFYNGKNDLGVKECWMYKDAKVVRRFKLGWWTQPSSPEVFEEVMTLSCHNAAGRYALYDELPAHVRAMPEMNLWVDDSKPAPEGFAVARTYDDALRMLRRFRYEKLYLDHDLGEDARSGYDLLMVLIAEDRVPPEVECISWNPSGKKRILAALEELGR